MTLIYTKTPQTEWWAKQTGIAAEITQDFDRWYQHIGPKISFLEIIDFDDDTKDLANTLQQHSNLSVFFVLELIDDQWCRELDRPNTVLMLNGRLNWKPTQAQVSDCFYFFWSTVDFYKSFPDLLEAPSSTPTHCFDVLLGRRKLHRDWIYHNIDRDQNIVTYFPTHQDQDLREYDQDCFIWPDALPKPDYPVDFTVQEVTVDGVIVSLSQIIPWNIYSKTHYSLVTETAAENGWSFFTEKIAKPILAKRLFLVVSGQHYLKNLRDLGFKTFGDIIDESYDDEPDLKSRAQMVLEQVNRLCQLPEIEVQKKIAAIVEHNFNTMTSANWQSTMIQQLAGFVNNK